MMKKRKIVVWVVSAVVFLMMLVMALGWVDALDEAIGYLKSAKISILLLLIPNTVLMFYAAGRIWYPYLGRFGLSAGELGGIQYELHFVNTVVPSASLSGLVYATERLKPYGVSPGYTGGMYVYRYIVSVTTNWIGIIGATLVLLVMGKLNDMPVMPMVVMIVMIVAMVLVFTVLLLALTGKIRTRNEKVDSYLSELRRALLFAKMDKRGLASSWAWGMLYTILEDTPFLIVAWSMGHSELFLQLIVAAAAGDIVGAVIPTPGGIGGFEGAMIYLLGGFGMSVALASAIVAVTRILTLSGTVITSYFFWQRSMVKLGRENVTERQ